MRMRIADSFEHLQLARLDDRDHLFMFDRGKTIQEILDFLWNGWIETGTVAPSKRGSLRGKHFVFFKPSSNASRSELLDATAIALNHKEIRAVVVVSNSSSKAR